MSSGSAAFGPKALTPRVVKLGRRYSLHHATGWYVVVDDKRPSQPGERYPDRERGQALNRYHELEHRHGRRRGAWSAVLQLSEPLRDRLQVHTVAVVALGVLCVVGLIKATGNADSLRLAGAFAVATGPNGVPYVAFVPSPPETEGDSAAKTPEEGSGKNAPAPLLLLPLGDTAAFGGFLEGAAPRSAPGPDPGPGQDPKPGHDPKPGPNPGPKPGPDPSPSPTQGPPPEPLPGPQPQPDPSPDPSPTPSPTPDPSPDPSPTPSPSPDPSPDPSPTPSPSPDPSPTSVPPPPTGPSGGTGGVLPVFHTAVI